MHLPTPLTLLLIALLSPLVSAQFGFFDQMFGGGGQQQQQGEPQNVPSDPTFYQSNWERMRCDKYLCPDTLACVHFPHHCPCAFPANEDKFETVDGHRLCVSKGGFKQGEAARKVELARKGML
ncbi:long chronological lifespan protein 2 [Eutypa lata UCREL1]|uniref:Long chronological lifespan protein 2 n=1 Tax=Eutypa lata (strain UCR-EL1) TaxID=1287681 RepID=M7TNS1_EUTLA|nr:long chronological lifespan protein 2 [Eutypa lata UCREL1]